MEIDNNVVDSNIIVEDNPTVSQKYNHPIINALHNINQMKYFKNEAACSGSVHNCARHEDAIAKQLEIHGFTRYNLDKQINSDLRKWETEPELLSYIPDNIFIEQPFGTHDNPDFLVKINNKLFIAIEAKSCKGSTPVFNSCIPKSSYIYIFCSEKYNKTTMFLGCSVITQIQRQLIEHHIEEARKRDEELNEKLKELDVLGRGISYYTRPMIQQKGSKEKTNYFTHESKIKTEEEVICYLEKKLIESTISC